MSYKALLIGASDYDAHPVISKLPFVRDDLRRLQAALSERDFASVEILESSRGITRTAVNARVRTFLRDAGPSDTLFVLLSGHGQHYRGADYLIPEDATFDIEPFADCCVEIGWHQELEDSAAARVVFLIDACREGFEQDSKSPAGVHGWSRPKIAAALRRKVAYVYACSPAQLALYVRPTDTPKSDALKGGTAKGAPGESFSLFSRAVSDVVTEVTHAVDLAEFEEQVQARIAALHTGYGKAGAPQRVRVATDVERRGFAVLPGPAKLARAHPWVRSVAVHPAWDRTPPGPARDALQAVCGALAAQLAEGFEQASAALRDDPWHDRELGRRAQDRMHFLIGQVRTDVAGFPPAAGLSTAAGLSPTGGPSPTGAYPSATGAGAGLAAAGAALSPTEAALVVLLPLVGQAFWTGEAAQRAGVLADGASGPERDRFQEFTRTYPRLVRRLRTLDQAGDRDGDARRIRWWLFHRWLLQQPELYAGQSLKSLLGPRPTPGGHPDRPGWGVTPVSDRPGWGDTSVPDRPDWVDTALSADRFARFIQDQRTVPFAVSRGEALAVHDVVAASTGDEHEVRQAFVASLAKAAHALAIDPVDLPEIVVEHLGISDHVHLGELLATLRGSDWRTSGVGRSLNAACQHPAVQIALREHAQRTDALLRDINRAAALAPLRSLPPYADADLVRLTGNTPEHLSDGIRFQLAEDRVQELLMGESLYGDRKLAIRELYQNALDALRYRDARTQYLRRTGAGGRRGPDSWTGEIAFHQGVDSDGRPYLECRDNGIGMGVHELSRTFAQGGTRFVDLPEYIEEQTAWSELDPRIELYPNSRFGIGVLSYFMLADEIVVHTCRMGRDGRPGRLLKVTIAGPGNLFRIEDAGEGEETGTSVRLILARGKAQVSCVDTLEELLWVAQYRTTAEHGARRLEWGAGEFSERALERHWFENPRERDPGGGLFPSSDPDLWWIGGVGVVLSDGLYAQVPDDADRTVHGIVVNLHGPHRPELTVDRATFQNFEREPLARRAIAAVPSLAGNGRQVLTPAWLSRISSTSLPLADAIVEGARGHDLAWPIGDGQALFDAVGTFAPDGLLASVLTGDDLGAKRRPHAASAVRQIPAAVLRWRFTTLLSAGLGGGSREALPGITTVAQARPSDLAVLCGPWGSIWEFNLDFWLDGPGHTHFAAARPSPYLTSAGAPSLARPFSWRQQAETISVPELFACVALTGRRAGDVADRLRELGFRTESLAGAEDTGPEDLSLLRPLGDKYGWLEPAATLSAAQISFSAAMADRPTEDAARRLSELGFRGAEDYPRRTAWLPEEREVLGRLWDAYGTRPTPAEAKTVSAVQLLAVAARTNLSVGTTARHLRELGFSLPPDNEIADDLSDDDRALLVHGTSVLPVDRPVPLPHLLAVTARTGLSTGEVARRLAHLGYQVDPSAAEPDASQVSDAALLLRTRIYPDYWPVNGEPVSLFSIAQATRHADDSLTAIAAHLARCGLSISADPAVLSRLGPDDVAALADWQIPDPQGVGPVAPPHLYAVAAHVNRRRADVARDLASLGYEIAPPDEEFERDVAAEYELEWLLAGGEGPLPPMLDALSEQDPTPPHGRPISLSALAAIALRNGMPLRHVAAAATQAGLRHEAETWFDHG